VVTDSEAKEQGKGTGEVSAKKSEKNAIPAQRIANENGGVLVEWVNRLGIRHRSWVKPSMILEDNGQSIVVESPERGVPYGDDLSILFEIDPEINRDFAAALKNQGIWTYADVMARPQLVQGVLQSVYGVALSNVLQAAGAATKAAKAE